MYASQQAISKRAGKAKRTRMSGVITSSEFFVRKARSPRMCKDVHSWACFRFISARLLASAPPICKRRLMTVMDAASENPQRSRTDMDVRGSTQQRCFCSTKTRVQKYTRMYTSGQAIFKRLMERFFPSVFTFANMQRIYAETIHPCIVFGRNRRL